MALQLTTFGTEYQTNGSATPRLSVVGTSNRITFNRAATTMLKINLLSKVLIHRDSIRPTDWYVEVSTAGNAIPLSHQTKVGYCIKSKFIADELRKTCGKISGVRIEIGTEPIEGKYWPLITLKAKQP